MPTLRFGSGWLAGIVAMCLTPFLGLVDATGSQLANPPSRAQLHRDIVLSESAEDVRLTLQDDVGALVFRSLPSRCRISCKALGILREPKGKNHWIATGIPAGEYEFTFEADGERLRHWIRIDDGIVRRYSVNFLTEKVTELTWLPNDEGCIGQMGSSSTPVPHSEDAVGLGIRRPQILRAAQPELSAAAREMGLHGVVEVEALVNEHGRAETVCLTQRSHPLLDQAALQAGYQTVFESAEQDGFPVRMWTSLRYSFERNATIRVEE